MVTCYIGLASLFSVTTDQALFENIELTKARILSILHNVGTKKSSQQDFVQDPFLKGHAGYVAK